jgi:hypothetical protein
VRIAPTRRKAKPSRGELIVERLRGSATVPMSTDEIMKLMRGA